MEQYGIKVERTWINDASNVAERMYHWLNIRKSTEKEDKLKGYDLVVKDVISGKSIKVDLTMAPERKHVTKWLASKDIGWKQNRFNDQILVVNTRIEPKQMLKLFSDFLK